MDDFEAFKKKKADAKAAELKAVEDAKLQAAQDEANKKMGWIDGIGYMGATNPKVKGFIVGKARRKKVDPNELPEKPKGFESHRADAEEEEGEKKPAPAPEKPPQKPKGYSRY